MPMTKPSVLLIPLEFASWARARSWSYTAGGLAIEDGLRANGADCTVIPALCREPGTAMPAWLAHAKELVAGQRFDQVWVWLVHYPYEASFLEWLAGLAPIRVGLIMESLLYAPDVYRQYPHLQARAAMVDAQLRYLTHVLAMDERDADRLNEAGHVKAQFWPSAVPIRFVRSEWVPPTRSVGGFYGDAYGERQAWLSLPALRELLVHASPAEEGTDLSGRFDVLHREVDERMRAGWCPDPEALAAYVADWRRIREEIFRHWLQCLANWSAIVNLPSLFQSYPGRVVEAMAAGRPAISWAIPDRPRTAALFRDGEEILLYPKDRPAVLADHLRRLGQDQDYARAIAVAARAGLLQAHTAEFRTWQILSWIQDGVERPVERLLDRLSADRPESVVPATRSQSQTSACPSVDRFYVNLFVRSPAWSGPLPNEDERARWIRIARCLDIVAGTRAENGGAASLRMLDVGCGRGWLTNLASAYGRCEGVEPVGEVVDHARRLFPHLPFYVGTADSIARRPDFEPYDVVIASEVIEHVPDDAKAEFMEGLAGLVKPGGYVILTTPRAEVRAQWERFASPNQPVEDWLTEDAMARLLLAHGFQPRRKERICVTVPDLKFPEPEAGLPVGSQALDIYQVWLAQRTSSAQVGDAGSGVLRSDAGAVVSVIVPTYNRPDLLKEALESILAQTYRSFEIIVVNDGGQDVEAVVSSLDRGAHVLTYVRHPRNRGLAAARNTGLRLARGKYVAYLDDDDRFYPDHLETLVTFLEHSEYRVAYSDAWRVHYVKEGDRYVARSKDLPYSYDFNANALLVSNYFPVLTVVHERACLNQCGMFDETLTTHEDWDLWIRMSRTYPFAHVKRITAEFSWRTDGSTMTSRILPDFARTAEIIYRKYRAHAEAIPGLIEAQAKRLAEMKTAVAAPVRAGRPASVCSIIIPVWNKADLTRQCLEALAATTHGIEYEVIIVDNGSTDETPALLAGLGGDVQVIRNQENLGFAKACNQGAKAARGRYLVFLNNGTIPQPGWLDALVREVEDHADVAVVGSKLLYPDGTIQHAGVAFSRAWFTPYHLYRGCPADAPAVNRRREFQSVTGACMLVRREVFEEVGGFDEGYRNGFEDVDLCLKIKERGGRVVYQPKSVLYHLESRTPGRKDHDAENSRLLLARWGSCWWLADEDLLAFEDGVRCDYPSPHLVRWLPLADDAERDAWRMVAETQRAAQRRDDEAVWRWIREPGRWPADPGVLRWGARIAKALNETATAGLFWQRLLTLCEDADARFDLAKQAIAEGKLDEAQGHLDRLPSHAANGGEASLLRGVLAMQRRAFSQAANAFETALAHGADRRKALMGMGMASLGAGEIERSWEAFLALLKQEPDDAEVLHWVLRAGTALGRWKDLAEVLARFVDRNPGDLAARFALAGVLVREGRIAEARQEQQVLQLLDPQYEGLDALARALDGHPLYASSSVSG